MRIQTGSRQWAFKPVQFTFVHLHCCKLTSVKSFSSHENCTSIAWPLQFEPCQRKWWFSRRSFDFVSLRRVDYRHSRGPIRSQEPWFGRSSSQPSLPHWVFVCTREHWFIYMYRRIYTNNPLSAAVNYDQQEKLFINCQRVDFSQPAESRFSQRVFSLRYQLKQSCLL